jgi:hypothetical protein
MERLTVKWADKVYDTFDPVDVVDNEYSKANYNKILTRLGEYEDLEEQGLLLRLPYPLGTEYIYFVDIKDRKVYKLDAEKIEVNMTPISKKILYTVDGYEFLFEDFEKAIFLTREEAEVRLKELISRKEQQ